VGGGTRIHDPRGSPLNQHLLEGRNEPSLIPLLLLGRRGGEGPSRVLQRREGGVGLLWASAQQARSATPLRLPTRQPSGPLLASGRPAWRIQVLAHWVKTEPGAGGGRTAWLAVPAATGSAVVGPATAAEGLLATLLGVAAGGTAVLLLLLGRRRLGGGCCYS
jgi:hypothetical protein